MTDAAEYLAQVAEEILDGESHLRHLRAQEKPVSEGRELIRTTESEVDYLKRVYTATRIKAEAVIAGVQLPPVIEDELTVEIRERLRAAR